MSVSLMSYDHQTECPGSTDTEKYSPRPRIEPTTQKSEDIKKLFTIKLRSRVFDRSETVTECSLPNENPKIWDTNTLNLNLSLSEFPELNV
jgi:hypothetical protein